MTLRVMAKPLSDSAIALDPSAAFPFEFMPMTTVEHDVTTRASAVQGEHASADCCFYLATTI